MSQQQAAEAPGAAALAFVEAALGDAVKVLLDLLDRARQPPPALRGFTDEAFWAAAAALLRLHARRRGALDMVAGHAAVHGAPPAPHAAHIRR